MRTRRFDRGVVEFQVPARGGDVGGRQGGEPGEGENVSSTTTRFRSSQERRKVLKRSY